MAEAEASPASEWPVFVTCAVGRPVPDPVECWDRAFCAVRADDVAYVVNPQCVVDDLIFEEGPETTWEEVFPCTDL